MRTMKVYLDTSVISYINQKDAPERMKETQDIWEFFKKVGMTCTYRML